MISRLKKIFCKYSFLELSGYAIYNFRYFILLRLVHTFIFKIKSKLLNINYGVNPKIYGSLHIIKFPNSKVIIGNDFLSVGNKVRATARSGSINLIKTYSPNSKVIIGNNVHMTATSIICRSTEVNISDNVLIGPNTVITDSDIHCLDIDRRLEPCPERDREVNIGKNVFIGMNCSILKGVKIGDNSIIGAGSVVLTDVEANSIYAGNPAKFIRKVN